MHKQTTRTDGLPAVRTWGALWTLWSGNLMADVTRALILLAGTCLFLSAAGTIEVGYTLTPSYVLVCCAVLTGLPYAVAGWLRLPLPCRTAAAALVVVYMLGVVFGSGAVLPTAAARSSHRSLLYLADIVLGLAVVGLSSGLFSGPDRSRRLAAWIAVGGAAAALYATYQWFALHYGWPLADVNNTVNSDGYTTGRLFQGTGLLGWERVRGTFKEPLLLGSYEAMTMLVSVGLAATARGSARAGWTLAALTCAVALLLTDSSLSWGVTGLVCLIGATAWSVARGRIRTAAVLGATLAAALLIAPLTFVDPTFLTGVTGRSATALKATTENRVGAWREAIAIWDRRPLTGYGPGQSAVRTAYRPPKPGAPVVLGSAQGLWAAALLDTGLVGLAAWTAALGALVLLVGGRVLRRMDLRSLALLCAALVGLLLGNLSGDRLDLRVWVVLGLAVAASRGGAGEEPGREAGDRARERADEGGASR